jgi:hypothetical protein
MRAIRLLACAGYWGLLTVLLLIPDPAAAIGLDGGAIFPWGDVGVHFTAFTILAVLVHSSQWPEGIRWPVCAVLLAYGITTESLQWFVPTRMVQPLDYMENILGIAAGTVIYWPAHRLIQKRRVAKMTVVES